MPTVPTYDGLRVAPSAQPMPEFQASSAPNPERIAGDQLQQAGQALGQAGGAAGRIAADMQQQANELRVNDSMNQYMAAQTTARVELLQLKGKNALDRPDGKSLPDEYGEKLDQVAQGIAEKLGNTAQRQAFTAAAQRQGIQFRAAASQHMVQQADVYKKETQKATIDTAVNQGALLWGDKAALAQSKATITRAVDDIARDHGMDSKARDMALVESLTPLHMGVMKSMITAGMANDAKGYYEANSAEMTLQGRAQMQGVVKQASDVQTGESAADAVWGAVGPQGANDAVKIFDMEREVRAKLKDNPDAMKHGIDSLRQRSQAFNAQQSEANAAGVNSVFAMVDGKVPMSTIMRSGPWLALPALKQHEIAKTLENEQHAREQRALTAEQRGLVAAQRADHALILANADAYSRYTDPQALFDIKDRRQVEAMRAVFGFEPTQHLLAKWDSLQKPGAVGEASIDKQDFDAFARRMEMDPLSKSPAEKVRVEETQRRVEQLILQAQAKKGQALSRQEKTLLMQEEVARTVTVNPLLGFSREVPVVGVQADQVKNVVVPSAQRESLVADMARLYAVKKDPQYAPNNDNLKRYYLRKTSVAADLIGPK